ncbi:MAG: lysylphosphatidylglycerol synthase transmembrane domain-containing protein [Terracidiphilus sp.]
MKKKQLILGLVVLAALAGLVVWARERIHFDFGMFRAQVSMTDWRLIGAGVACIYLGYVVRAARWALLLRPNKRVPVLSLVGSQVMGYTAVALIGRVADPVRPYLVAKKTSLPISSQLAVYIVERLFDTGTIALIFSLAILLAPAGTLPHPEIVKKAGYWGMALTIAGAAFLVLVRLSGGVVATLLEHSLGLLSKRMGQAVGNKIRAFHAGLDTMRSFSDFAYASSLSFGMWCLIALSYLLTMRAFVASPVLATMTIPKAVLVLAFSGTASVLQLPILGWFTQIGLVAAALTSFIGTSTEAATACAAMLLVVTFLSIVPVGLIWAQFEHVSLRKVTAESEHVGDDQMISESPEPAE